MRKLANFIPGTKPENLEFLVNIAGGQINPNVAIPETITKVI